MVDITTPEVRSRMMSGIRGKNTKPELIVRKALHKQGLRFRLHNRALPGIPDIVLPRYRTVIFVHGCFWHQHACPLFKLPATRTEFWEEKLAKNKLRDEDHKAKLLNDKWRVAVVWECSLRRAAKEGGDDLLIHLVNWIRTPHGRSIEL